MKPSDPGELMQPNPASVEVKVIMVKGDLSEFQELLNRGWKIAVELRHPDGALIVMQRASTDVRL